MVWGYRLNNRRGSINQSTNQPINQSIRIERTMVKYQATITVDVEDAEAPEMDYLHQKAGELVDYLSFEGERVEVAVEVKDGVDV